MRNNETGEFELVVGNKQLLSGFFIGVVLFALAFVMGYVVGQNTQRPAKLASEGGPASTATNASADFAAATGIAGAAGSGIVHAPGFGHGTAAATGLGVSGHPAAHDPAHNPAWTEAGRRGAAEDQRRRRL